MLTIRLNGQNESLNNGYRTNSWTGKSFKDLWDQISSAAKYDAFAEIAEPTDEDYHDALKDRFGQADVEFDNVVYVADGRRAYYRWGHPYILTEEPHMVGDVCQAKALRNGQEYMVTFDDDEEAESVEAI